MYLPAQSSRRPILNRNIRIGIIVVILGGAFLAGGIYIVMRLFSSVTSGPQPVAQVIEPFSKQVVITTRDLPLGAILRAEDVTTLKVPVEVAPRDVMLEPGAVVGRMTTAAMTVGEMVLNHRLTDPTNVSHDLAYTLEENQVLFAFPASDLMSTLNIVQRGDLVDILVSIEQTVPVVEAVNPDELIVTTPAEEETESRLFTFSALQSVDITATVIDVRTVAQGDNAQTSPPTTRAYLLAVSPQDALVLKHLRDSNAIFDLVLRAPTSAEQFNLVPVISEYLVDRYQLELTK
jgi:pilus assembly protein CpaB